MEAVAQWEVENEGPCGFYAVPPYAAAGKNQQALDILECAFEEINPNLPYLGAFVAYAALHKEPRFQEMLRRLNFPEDVLAGYLNEMR